MESIWSRRQGLLSWRVEFRLLLNKGTVGVQMKVVQTLAEFERVTINLVRSRIGVPSNEAWNVVGQKVMMDGIWREWEAFPLHLIAIWLKIQKLLRISWRVMEEKNTSFGWLCPQQSRDSAVQHDQWLPEGRAPWLMQRR